MQCAGSLEPYLLAYMIPYSQFESARQFGTHCRLTKTQASLCKCADSSEPFAARLYSKILPFEPAYQTLFFAVSSVYTSIYKAKTDVQTCQSIRCSHQRHINRHLIKRPRFGFVTKAPATPSLCNCDISPGS